MKQLIMCEGPNELGLNPDALVETIKEYKRIKGAQKKDELYLADLLK